MDYKKMIENARKSGNWSEKMMLDSVDSIAELLECVKKANPQGYWRFMREQAGIMLNCHYDKVWAEYDVSQMYSTNKDGKKCEGAIYTPAETEEMSKGWTMPSGTTKWDVYVALNAAAHDFGKYFDKEQIAKIAKCFYFSDEDFKGKNKVWAYMEMVHSL